MDDNLIHEINEIDRHEHLGVRESEVLAYIKSMLVRGQGE